MNEIDRFFEENGLTDFVNQMAQSMVDNFMISGEITLELPEILMRASDSLLDMIIETWTDEAEFTNRREKEDFVEELITKSFQSEIIFLDVKDIEILIKTMNNLPLSNMDCITLMENYCKKGWVFMFGNVDTMDFVVPRQIKEIIITTLKEDTEQKMKMGLVTGVRFTLRACLNLFGVIEREKLKEIAIDQMFERANWSEKDKQVMQGISEKIDEVIDILAEREEEFWCDGEYIISIDFEDERDYKHFLRKVSGKDYFIPSGKEIKAYAENQVDIENPYYQKLKSDLTKLFKDKVKADDILFEIEFRVVQDDMSFGDIVKLLNMHFVVFPNETRADYFAKNCKKWLYTVKRWSNRGFSNEEIGKPDDTEEVQSLVSSLQEQGQTVRKEPKIGRNDPCPCGSGKKYKKCCGR